MIRNILISWVVTFILLAIGFAIYHIPKPFNFLLFLFLIATYFAVAWTWITRRRPQR